MRPAERERHAVVRTRDREPVAPRRVNQLLKVDEVVGVAEVSLERPVERDVCALGEGGDPGPGGEAEGEGKARRLHRGDAPGAREPGGQRQVADEQGREQESGREASRTALRRKRRLRGPISAATG